MKSDIVHETGKEVIVMQNKLTGKDIEDGKRISALFSNISEESKMMAIVYLSALRDKEIAETGRTENISEKV